MAACRHTGVSIAAVALTHGLNANLVRRWVEQEERGARSAKALPRPAPADEVPAFVPLNVEPPSAAPDIRIELQHGRTLVKVSWSASAAGECAAWLRELLR
ncbi:IS66 family insertion sequence element accessory protein TnpB [Caldimonas brevitalea]|uniref:IS66 family insertion sequence element accessory protein TnpB n=1 Tax=Caldimonas brevitalea TaxID=413882 RepID=UPI003AA978AA